MRSALTNFAQTSNILTKRRIASVEAMFLSPFQLQDKKTIAMFRHFE